MTSAILNTLAWIHAHSPEEIMAKMPPEMVGKNKELYLAALKNTIPMYSETGKMDPKGADAVLAVFSESSPDVAKANIDVSKTYTNKYRRAGQEDDGDECEIESVSVDMTPPVIHRVTTLDLSVQPWPWPFADERRAEIDAHFAAKRREKPQLWNGRVLLARHPVLRRRTACAPIISRPISQASWPGATGVFRTAACSTASAWARCAASDGAFVLGEMAEHTANAGRIYFPAGTPDLDDVSDGRVDIAGSVAREIEEETGLTPADYRAGRALGLRGHRVPRSR